MAFKISDIPLVDNSADIPATEDSSAVELTPLTIPQSTAPPAAMLTTLDPSPVIDEDKDYNQALGDWYRSGQDALDNAVFDSDKAFKGMNLDFEADPETAKRTLINESWMELNHDEPLAPTDLQRAVQMQVASLAKFNEMASTPEELYTLIKKDAGKRKNAKALGQDLQVAAYDDAMLPADESGGYAAFREKLKTHAGYDPERQADYLEAWHETRNMAKEKVDAFREPLVQVWRAFKLDGNITAAAMDAYAKLTPEQRPEFMDALAIRAKALSKEEQATFWGNMGKQTDQAISDYGRNAAESAISMGLAQPTDPTIGIADAVYGTKNYAESETGRLQAKKDFQMRRNFAADVRNVSRLDYDPLKSAFGEGKPGFWEGVAYQVPGVTATSMSMAVPVVGMATMTFAMEGQAYEQMRGRMLQAGKTDEEATAIAEGLAPLIALPQAALEKVGFGIWSRKLPGFSKALDALGDKITNRVLRGTVKVGTIGAAETAIELAQDSLVYGVQDIAAALADDVPEVDWNTELAGTWAQAPEIFFTMLPLSILGAAGGLSQESRNAAFARATPTELQALGINTDGIVAINAANGPASLATAVDTAMATRDPNSEEAKVAVEVLKAQVASARQARESLEQLGYRPPTMTQTPEGIFVFDGDGNELGVAQNFAGANRIISAHTSALDNLEKDRVDALTSLMEGVKAAVDLDPTSETQVNFDEMEMTPAQAAAYGLQSVLKEQAEGGTGNVARSVLGYSVTEMAQGALRTVNRLFKNASITDAFHETAHGLRRKAHAAGTVTRAMEASLLINQDLVYAGRQVRDEKGKQTGAKIGLVPEGITKEMLETGNIPAELIPEKFNGNGHLYAEKILDEGVSEIVEVEVLKLRIGKGKGKLGITRELVKKNLEAMAKLNATDARDWKSFFEAIRTHWGIALSRVIAMTGAERRGEFDPAEREAYLNKLFGIDQQVEHDAAVNAEFDAMFGPSKAGEVAEDDIPFSIGRSTVTPTAETRTFEGAEGSPSVIGPAAFSIGAYHGTPHKIKGRMSLDYVGTGENGNMQGYGLYFAESEGLGDYYRRHISKLHPQWTYDGKVLGYPDPILQLIQAAQSRVEEDTGRYPSLEEVQNEAYYLRLKMGFPEFNEEKLEFRIPEGNLYKVELDVEDSELLAWDKSLKDQHPGIVEKLSQIEIKPDGFWEMEGYRFYNLDPMDIMGIEATTALLKLGIHGIRYLDGNSRADGEGSYNYVIFDESKIKITEENGKPVELGGESFSIGRATVLPVTTQKSLAIADPAPIGADLTADSGTSPVSFAKAFQSAPGEPGDMSPLGDEETDTSFSLGSARENYEKVKWRVDQSRFNLREEEKVGAEQRKEWEEIHGSVGDFPKITGYGFKGGAARNFGGGLLREMMEGIKRKREFPDFADYLLADKKRITKLMLDGSVLLENKDYDHAPFPEPSDLIAARALLAQAEADLYLAEEDFDPETDARLADAENIRHRELSKQAAMFAALLDARDEEAKNAAKSFVAKVWNAYGKHDEVFQFEKSTSKDAEEIAEAVSIPGKQVTATESGDSVRFAGVNGHLTVMDADTARPYIAASQSGSKGKKGGGGSQLYVAALDWIHNNGKRIKDDPAGLTGINAIRRTSNFFASAIRWGTTEHLKPHKDQKVGKWTKNDVLNTSLLASKEMENAQKAIPEIRGWTFDFASGSFFAASGEALTESDFAEVVAASDPNNSGIGISTVQRSIITASAIQEFQRGASETIVEQAESDLPGELRGVSYSLGPAKVAGILSDNALGRITDPRRRTYVMSKISKDFNAMRLQIERISSLAGIRRSKGDLKREAMAREDLAAEEKIAAIHARFGSLLADDDLVKIKSQPVHAHLADPLTPLRGRLMSKAAAIKANPEKYQLHRGGEYDGSEAVSRSVFGGQNMPDQMAQELFDHGLISEPTADAMWEALLSEQKTVAGMKEMLLKAKDQIREAKLEAKQEANEWLATQSKDQEVNFSDKEEIRRALRMLDAILLALPAEIRGKIGGYTQISMIGTDEARLAYLTDKLAKADKELETFLRVEYAKEWEELLIKAAPKTNEAGQRPTGSIAADAYEVFKLAEWAMGQSFVDGEAEATKWDSIADHEDTTEEAAALASTKAQMIRLTMNWTMADAARREQAVLEGDKIYFGGLRELKIEASRRRERLGKLRTSAITGTGKTGHRMELKAAEEHAKGSRIGKLKSWGWELLSPNQVIDVIFGEDSTFAKWANAMELACSNAKEDGFQAKVNGLEALFDTLAGSRFGGVQLRHRLATVNSIQVKDALGVDQAFTEAEAITFLLMYRQEDGKRHMQGIIDEQSGRVISSWGWDDASAAEVQKGLSKEGLAALAFLGNSYGEEYGRINEVFRRIWNVAMPSHKMYSPLSVKSAHGKADTITDPSSGETMGAGMTPSSLKNRSFSAIAEPDFKDAFQVYLTHARQMEHFIAYGEFSRDALAIINRREARTAIAANAGPYGAKVLSGWMDYFALGGIQGAKAGGALWESLGNALGRLAPAMLVGRVSVLAMQWLQTGAASFKMPTGAFLLRFAKLHTGQLNWADAINSPFIQRRLSEMPPAVQDMMRSIAAAPPNRAKYLHGQAGRSIAYADATFTAGTYAIFYDYHLKLAKDMKLANPEAYAHSEAERLTDQVAQPIRPGARSWLEISTQGDPAFRAMWNFSTDPRQKFALWLYAMMRRDKSGLEKAKNVGITGLKIWLVGGIGATVIRAIMRDIKNDDDDEVIDERHWNPKRMALMASMGPLGGIPILGGMLEEATYSATGEYMPKGGVLSGLGDAAALPRKWAKGKVEPLKDIETMATGAATVSGTAGAAASAMHLIRDSFGIVDNFTDWGD